MAEPGVPSDPAVPPDLERERAETAAALLRAATPHVWVTPLFAAALVVCFLVSVKQGADLMSPTASQLVRIGADFGPLLLEGQWWRLWTSALLHAGLVHLLFNLWALWDAGRLAERIFGNAAFATLLLLSTPAAALLSVAVRPLTVSVGASGAIFGVYGALVTFAWTHREVFPREVLRQQRNSLLGFLVVNLGIGLSVPSVGLAAHLGGLLAGMALGWLLRRDLRAPSRDVRRRAAGALALATALVAGAWGVRERVARVPEVRARRLAAELTRRCQTAAREAGADAGKIAAAVAECSRAADANPRDGYPLRVRGALRASQGQLEEALADLGRAVAVEPSDARAHLLRARVLRQLDRLAAAEEDCTALCPGSGDEADPACPVECADVAWRLGDARKALERTGWGLARRPADVALLRERAFLRQEAGDAEGAMADLDQVLRLQPDDAAALNDRAWGRVLRGDFAGGLVDAEASLAIRPDDPHTLGTRCFALAGLGRRDEARKDCARAVAPRPGQQADAADAGMLAFLEGRTPEAVRLWRQAIGQRPSRERGLAPWIARAEQAGPGARP